LDKGFVPLSPACQRRPATAAKIADAGWRRPTALRDNGPYLRCGEILLVPIALFDVLLQFYLLEVYLLADRQAGKLRPLVAKMQHFAHLIEELRMRIVMPPAPSIAKLDEILLPTLDQSEPATGDTVVRTLLPFRHEGSQTAVESALPDNQRASLIRATKMSAAPGRLFVDFLFVDNSVDIDSTAQCFSLYETSKI
jgi:hypothetical protein